MSKLTATRCDRCNRFCRDEETFASVAIVTAPADESAPIAKRELDLCDACEAGLVLYVDGAKLARVRKATP